MFRWSLGPLISLSLKALRRRPARCLGPAAQRVQVRHMVSEKTDLQGAETDVDRDIDVDIEIYALIQM